jgi:RNA-directed DNA polymerase
LRAASRSAHRCKSAGDGQWSESNKGTPQGPLAPPLIANAYLQYLLDLWADVWCRKAAKGEVIIVRYSGDVVLGFSAASGC